VSRLIGWVVGLAMHPTDDAVPSEGALAVRRSPTAPLGRARGNGRLFPKALSATVNVVRAPTVAPCAGERPVGGGVDDPLDARLAPTGLLRRELRGPASRHHGSAQPPIPRGDSSTDAGSRAGTAGGGGARGGRPADPRSCPSRSESGSCGAAPSGAPAAYFTSSKSPGSQLPSKAGGSGP
jgi:hypothetical protein